MSVKNIKNELEISLNAAFENGISMEDAERQAFKALASGIALSDELKIRSLDARMKKSGVKALRSAVYLSLVQGSDKKPTEAMLAATIDSHDDVIKAQDALDEAEVEVEELKRLVDTFHNSQLTFRSIMKGSFGS